MTGYIPGWPTHDFPLDRGDPRAWAAMLRAERRALGLDARLDGAAEAAAGPHSGASTSDRSSESSEGN